MNDATRLRVIQAADERRRKISVEKGKEYTGEGENFADESADVLRNFKANAERLGVDPLMTAALYFGKHVDSFFTFIRNMQGTTTEDERKNLFNAGEGMLSRFDDMRNYIDLMECLVWEMELHPHNLTISCSRYPDLPPCVECLDKGRCDLAS